MTIIWYIFFRYLISITWFYELIKIAWHLMYNIYINNIIYIININMADSKIDTPYVYCDYQCDECDYEKWIISLCQFCGNRKGTLPENVLLNCDLPAWIFNKFAGEIIDCMKISNWNLSGKQIKELQSKFYPKLKKDTAFFDKIRDGIVNLFK